MIGTQFKQNSDCFQYLHTTRSNSTDYNYRIYHCCQAFFLVLYEYLNYQKELLSACPNQYRVHTDTWVSVFCIGHCVIRFVVLLFMEYFLKALLCIFISQKKYSIQKVVRFLIVFSIGNMLRLFAY